MRLSSAAFTLVELLVVVTIIVVLLALLAPALDRAIYETQLTVCSAQQKTLAMAGVNYTLDHKRLYPYRPAVWRTDSNGDPDTNWQACSLYYKPGAWGPFDDRPTFRPYMDINRLLNDPLAAKVILDRGAASGAPDPEDFTADVLGNQMLWYGFKYKDEKGMLKIGDRWTYEGRSYELLVSDRDVVGGTINVPNPTKNLQGWATQATLKQAGVKAAGTQCSHPDSAGQLYNEPLQNGAHPWGGQGLNLTQSMWINLSDIVGRGTVDVNHAFQDLSVRRSRAVEWRDYDRMDAVWTWPNKGGGPQQIPRAGGG